MNENEPTPLATGSRAATHLGIVGLPKIADDGNGGVGLGPRGWRRREGELGAPAGGRAAHVEIAGAVLEPRQVDMVQKARRIRANVLP
jgi:hypothetical protein